MRLLRLDGGPSGPTVDLHPFFTVIRGLAGEPRHDVLRALRALPAGEDPGLAGLVEAHGVLLDLDQDNLRLLDLAADLDVVVQSSDLDLAPVDPGAGPAGTSSPQPSDGDPPGGAADAARAAEEAQETYAALRDGLDRLHDQRQRVSDEVAKAAAALEAARSELDPFAAGAVDQAVQELTAQEQQLAVESGLAGAASAAPTPPGQDVEQLEARRAELLRALEALAGLDVSGVLDALALVRAAEGVQLVANPEAVALADALGRATRALEQYDAQLDSQGFGPEVVRRRVEELRLQVARLEQAARPRTAAPEDVAALEEVHAAVVEAEERASGRLSGKGAQRRLEELQAEEQAILDRLGFPSYTAFSFSAAAPEVDVEARVALHDAQQQLVAAEQQAQDLARLTDEDPRRQELVSQLEQIRQQALPLVGGDDRGDLEAALRSLRIRPEAPVDVLPPEEAAARLRSALEHHGVSFGDRPLAPAEVAQVAAVWLAEMEDSTTSNQQRLQQELAQVDAALAEAKVPGAPVAVAPQQAVVEDPRLAPFRDAVRSAEMRLARHRSVVARVASLHAELEAASEKERELLEQVEAHSAVLDQAGEHARATSEVAHRASQATDQTEGLSAPPDPQAQASSPDPDQVEWYLLSRLSAQRSVSYAGSVPLVLDEALLGRPTDEVRSLLDHLERLSESVQIIYLSDDRDVLDWVASAGIERAAAVTAA